VHAHVTRIAIAPVKGLGLVHPDAVDLLPTGVAGDRRFWMVDGDGRLMNAKVVPDLLQIQPRWDETTNELELRFPDGTVAEGVVEPGEPVDAVLYGEQHASRRVKGPWAAAVSEFAGRPVTLLWSESGAVDRCGYGTGWMSLVSRASLQRLGEVAGAEQVDGRRFRMLFEIDGVGPHEEDEWIGRPVDIGGAQVRPAGDVGRCVITNLDPDTGTSDLDTLGALARYRREGRTEPLPFGVYGEVLAPGRIAVGDPVQPDAAT
jgi:uncharacterized protein YcbX